MKRKVIQIANSTQLVSLPRKWALQHDIKKGDEVNVEEQGDRVVISTEEGPVLTSVEKDITDFDSSSILHYIQSAYKMGYDEIKLNFNNPETLDFKTNDKLKTMSVIQKTVERLIGVEIINQHETSCLIKDISATSFREFDNVLKRVFILLLDISNDFLVASKTKNMNILETMDERHNTVTKFIAFCLRLLNKKGYKEYKKTPFFYHIIASLDKITDVLKYIARDILEARYSMRKETMSLFESVNSSLINYYELFYKFERSRLIGLSKNRRVTENKINKLSKALPSADVLFLGRCVAILDLLLDITESRMALED